MAAGGVVLALGLRATAAHGEPAFALAWSERPGACVTAAALREVVTEKLGRDPFTDRERADVVIEGEEAPAGARLRARVLERGRDGAVLGAREIDADSCPRLIRATGIVVALFVKASEEREAPREPGDEGGGHEPIAGREPAEEHAPSDRGAPPVPPPPVRPPRAQPLPREQPPPGAPSRPFALSLGVGGAAAVGILPSASGALRGVARLERARSRFSFEWSAGYTLPQAFRSRAVRGTLAAVDQQVRACVDLLPERGHLERRVRVDACGGAFWGAVVPRTAGLGEQNETWRPLAGPEAALAVQLREGTRAGRLDLGIAAPVVGRTFYFQGADATPERLYSTGRVIVFLGVSGLLSIL